MLGGILEKAFWESYQWKIFWRKCLVEFLEQTCGVIRVQFVNVSRENFKNLDELPKKYSGIILGRILRKTMTSSKLRKNLVGFSNYLC